MGTKPGLRPDVSLVGVLDADWLIRRPDFRSAESAYQALAEMAEWAGPAAGGGRVVVQTREPNHHAIQAVVRADHDFFVQRELEQRRELVYPPFVELLKVTARGGGARDLLAKVATEIGPLARRVLGPVEVTSGGDEPALQLLVKCRAVEPVADALRVILETTPRGTRISVDADPR
jgi:primosomal protein N' (replication factor Y)